ncbi:MAG: hypothetical protein ACT4P3_13115, partial [Betaproteobacteria bacterium]
GVCPPPWVSLRPARPGVSGGGALRALISSGRAGRPSTLRAVLEEHLLRRHPCTARASHYAWQLALDPARKERELLAQYRAMHRQFPRCNRAEP